MQAPSQHSDIETSHSSDSRNCPSTADSPPVDDVPEGGRDAWLVVFGSFLAMFSTFGIVNAYGTFQDYYTTTLLKNSSSSTISLIGALQLFLLYGLGPVIGKVFDAYGTKVLIPLGSSLIFVSMILVSVCQGDRPYQLFLSQGVLFGLGNAMIFTPALAIVGHWFRRRRAYVIGIVAAGSSLGGVIYPIMFQRLIPQVGFPWAVRITAFITLACLIVASCTMKTRLPLKRSFSLSTVIDLNGFRDPRYSLAAVGSFLYFYAVFIPFFYIQLYANYRGLPPNRAQYLLAIINAFGIPARIIPGLLGDRFGILPILVPCTLTSGILVLALWLPSRGEVSIIVFSALYGLFSGAFISLLPAYVATIVPPDKFGARLGSIYPLVAIATLVGTPTAGAFVPIFNQENFDRLIIFTGALIIAGGLTLASTRLLTRKMSRCSSTV